MEESFLHFVWQTGMFDMRNLVSVSGSKFEIVNRGKLNENEGPDFEKCQILWKGNNWYGNVEIHIKSSDWAAHKHQYDYRYNTTILHVVYEFDKDVYRQDGTRLPCIELKNRISPDLLLKYENMHKTLHRIPCAAHKELVTAPTWKQSVHIGLKDRFIEKANLMLEEAQNEKYNWEKLLFTKIAKTLGGKVNALAMQQLAEQVPIELTRKLQKLADIEAVLFGQSGLIPKNDTDHYGSQLLANYTFLSHKFELQPMSIINWKYMRMHPHGFPTMRIAQLAVMIFEKKINFSTWLGAVMQGNIEALQVDASHYWVTHYRFGVETSMKSSALGNDMHNRLLINAILPCLYAYSIYRDDKELKNKVFEMLNKMPAEKNAQTRDWNSLGVKASNAFESQGLIGLQQLYCEQRRCLECPAGKQIFNGNNR